MIYFPVFIIHIHTFYLYYFFFFFHDTATTEIYTLSLHDALPISTLEAEALAPAFLAYAELIRLNPVDRLLVRSEEHTSELQSQFHLVCRLLLEKKKKQTTSLPAIKKKVMLTR